ncbi:YjdF family protein [Fusibacter bizertensis]
MKVNAVLTIYFESPFWVGVYERLEGEQLEVSRIVFGAEPKDYEVYAFLNENWKRLKFSNPVKGESEVKKHINPKRMHRLVNAQLSQKGVSTKAQEAIRLQREETKLASRKRSKQEKELEQKLKFEQNQEKRKQKHRGK